MDSLIDDLQRCNFTESALVVCKDQEKLQEVVSISQKLKDEFRKKRKRTQNNFEPNKKQK